MRVSLAIVLLANLPFAASAQDLQYFPLETYFLPLSPVLLRAPSHFPDWTFPMRSARPQASMLHRYTTWSVSQTHLGQ